MSDNVNHPPHYKGHPSGIECLDVVRHANHPIGCAIKYLWRVQWGNKPGADPVEDLMKAQRYIEIEIANRVHDATRPR